VGGHGERRPRIEHGQANTFPATDRVARWKDRADTVLLAVKVKPHDLDPASIAALVRRAIDDIHESGDERRHVLLLDLLCAAWGSPYARSQ
jgi:hypothetical protein